MKRFTVYLMTPYIAWEGVPAKDAAAAIAQCEEPPELDGNEPRQWTAIEEDPEDELTPLNPDTPSESRTTRARALDVHPALIPRR